MQDIPRLQFETTAVLAGAGISVPSGIASGQMFNRAILPRLVPPDHKDLCKLLVDPVPPRRHPSRGNVRFEQLVEIIRRFADPDLLIMDYLEVSWTPTTLHTWLASAIARGLVVMTTNLDSLIEVAYKKMRNEGVKQIVDRIEWNAFDPCVLSLFKLHGTIRRGDYSVRVGSTTPEKQFINRENRAIETFAVTLDRIGSLASSNRGTAAQFLLPDYILNVLRSVLAGRDLVIIGYSGSDDFDVMPSLKYLSDIYRRVIWIEHYQKSNPSVHVRGKLILIRGSTVAILEALFGEPLVTTSYPHDAYRALGQFCNDWAEEVALSNQQCFLISGSVLRAMGMLSNSLAVWEYGIDTVKTSEPAAAAQFCLLLGDAYLAERSWYYAEEVLEVAVARSARAGDLVLHVRSLLGYAYILAIEALNREKRKGPSSSESLDRGWQAGELWKQPLTLLKQLSGIYIVEPALVEYQVRIAIAIATLGRISSKKDFCRLVTEYNDAVSLLHHFENWKILNENKVLRAEYLSAIALAELEAGHVDTFERYRAELFSLCASLYLPLVHAIFVLESADLTGTQNPTLAKELYGQAEYLFRRAGYPVGVSEAILGHAVMSLVTGQEISSIALKEALFTFVDEHLSWNADLIDEISGAGDRPHAETCRSIRRRFYDNIQTHSREFLGKAGWLNRRQLAKMARAKHE